MPLTTNKNAITVQEGNTTQVLIAEQANYSDESISDADVAVISSTGVKSGGDLYKYQPRIAEDVSLVSEGTTIESVEFDGSASQTKDAPGPLDISGGMSIRLSANGSALPLRMLTQDKNPSWHIFGGVGQTIPAAVTVVAATSRLQDTAADATIADDLSSTNNPVQLRITPSAGAAYATGGNLASDIALITIEGTDYNDTPIREVVDFIGLPATWRAQTRVTEFWYKTVTKVTTEGFLDNASSLFTITSRDESALVRFTPQDDELVCFWTTEVSKGEVANIYNGIIMQEATIDISRDSQVNFDCSMLGRRAYLYRNLAGRTGEMATPTPPGSGVEKASPDVYGGWQANLTAENTDISIAVQEITLTTNQNLTYTNVLGDQFQPTPPSRSTKRLVQLECTVLYSSQNNYSEYFQSNRVLPNVNLRFEQTGLGAYPYYFELQIPEAQLTADPDPAVSDPGEIVQTLTMKAVKSPRFNYEYRFACRYSSYDRVRVYT